MPYSATALRGLLVFYMSGFFFGLLVFYMFGLGVTEVGDDPGAAWLLCCRLGSTSLM